MIINLMIISCEKESSEKENSERKGSLEGMVLNEIGQPIEGAKIEIEGYIKITNYNGKYLFNNLSAKEYTVAASKQSFLTSVQQVKIVEDDTALLNFTLSAGELYLRLSDSIKNVNANNSNCSLTVLSNSGWIIKNNSTWIDCLKQSGQGNENVNISYSKNQGDSSRIDSIIFISGSVRRKLVIRQSAPIKLLKYQGLIGNNEKGIKDSIFLLFNKPVIIKTIKSNWVYCVSEININQMNNNCAIKFDYPCAELGGEYPFTIMVSDNEGNSFYEEIDVPFYKSKLTIDGYISDFLLINDDKEILISAFSPSRIIKYSFELDSLIQSYDLSSLISPINLSYNPYNSKVYIMGSEPNAIFGFYTTIDRPEVYALSLTTGDITPAFTVQPDEFDSQYPANIPYEIGFTQTGMGIVLLKANESSALRWKLINSAKNDSIYNYPRYDGILNDYSWFNNVQANYNYSKLYLTKPYSSCDYGIFDGSTQTISLLRPSSTTAGNTLTPYRKSEKFYARQLYDQFIIDLNGNLSQITYFDSRHEGNADFSYQLDEENVIYLCEAKSFDVPYVPNKFYILNSNNGSILKSCDVIDGLNKFSTTIDGNYAVAYKNSNLYIFKTKDF